MGIMTIGGRGYMPGSPVAGAVPAMGQMPFLDPDAAAQADAHRFAAQQAADASKYQTNVRDAHFNQVFPWLQSQMNDLDSRFATAGGQSGPSPEITVGGVLNPQQVQQQVNAARANTDMTAATQMRANEAKTASQGFGSRSPLLAALNGQVQANALGQNVSNEREIRLGAARENAGQLLNSQVARENQFSNRMKEDIQRRQPYWQNRSALIGAISGLI